MKLLFEYIEHLEKLLICVFLSETSFENRDFVVNINCMEMFQEEF